MAHGEKAIDKAICGGNGNRLSNGAKLAFIRSGAAREMEIDHCRWFLGDWGLCFDYEPPSTRAEIEEEKAFLKRALTGLPSCIFANKRFLPSISAVYFIIKSGKVIYVGATANLKTRMVLHDAARRAIKNPQGYEIRWWPLQERHLRRTEETAIQMFKPEFNIRPQGWRDNRDNFFKWQQRKVRET